MRLESILTNSQPVTRRSFFKHVGAGIQGAALLHLFDQNLRADETRATPGLQPRPPHFPAKAKSVIHLFMNGGPSQMDLFDPKPALDRHHGEAYSSKIAGEIENIKDAGALMRSPFKFAQHGQCGMWVSDALPHLTRHVDDIALVRSLYTTNITHEPAVYLIQTGRMITGHPTFGSWVVYGLGSECQNLPAYVVLDDPLGLPVNGVENWQAGFLPPLYQGTRFRSTGSPVLNLRPETSDPPAIVQMQRDLLSQLDHLHKRQRPGQPKLDARIASTNWPPACRCQQPMPWTFPRKARRHWRCMASVASQPTPTVGAACSPGDWWSAVSVLCSSTSTRKSGTITPAWRKT